jgi:hypothetical protein
MGSRERKRAERRKRKRRSLDRDLPSASPTPPQDPAPVAEAAQDGEESLQERMARRSEEHNIAARASLEPLAAGERPRAVTVGACVSALLALIFTVSTIVAATGSVEISGDEPSPVPLAGFAAVLWMMTWGMFKARYWAVLGFQMLLVLFMLSAALGMVQATTIPQLLGTLLLLGGAGALFYFLIRSLARIQMPERPR